MKIKFNETGTHIRNGRLKIRLDFYPDSLSKTYALQNVNVFARELTEAEDEIVDGVLTEKAKELRKLVSTKKQLNPFLCHFIAIDPNMTREELIAYIMTTFRKDTLTQLDDILSVDDRKNELHLVLKDKLGKREKCFGVVDVKEINNRFRNLEVNL